MHMDTSNNVEQRKQEEREFHNKVRDEHLKASEADYRHLTSNKKFYSIERASRNFLNSWLLKHAQGRTVLDYCCGNGETSIFLAKHGIKTVGIDISDLSVENCKKLAHAEGVQNIVSFFVMDGEAMTFPSNSFDVIACIGVLHHLDTAKAFRELARVLKPGGKIICNEPLVYNPLFQLYRRLTPHLRTAWEVDHILRKKDFDNARTYFSTMELRFFHLFTLCAVPLRNTRIFYTFLAFLEAIDRAILRIPGIQWLAWQVMFILSHPKKINSSSYEKNT